MYGPLVHEKSSHSPFTLVSPAWGRLQVMINEVTKTDGFSRVRRFRVGLAVVMLVAVFAFPAFAAAQSPTDRQYGGGDELLEQQAGDSGSGSTVSDPSADPGLSGNVGPLPFTGFDVIAMAAVALAVTGVGLALQRAVTRESTDQA